MVTNTKRRQLLGMKGGHFT